MKSITEMNEDEFMELIDKYIERSSRRDDAIPTSTFLELLFQNALRDVQENIELTGHIINGQLELSPPTNQETSIQTRQNQILVDNRLITVQLEPSNRAMAA